MSQTTDHRHRLDDILDAVREIEEQVLEEDKTGATREQLVSGTCQRVRNRLRLICPVCGGRLRVSDAMYTDCEDCGESVLRTEVDI